MIDDGSKSLPDFYKIVKGTTRRLVSNDEWDNVLDKFPSLMKYFAGQDGSAGHGELPDSVLQLHDNEPM